MFWDLLILLSSDHALISSSLRGRVSGFASDTGKVQTLPWDPGVYVCVHTRVCSCMGGGQCNDTIIKYSRLQTLKVNFSFNSRGRDFRELILEMICRNELSWEEFDCWGKLSNFSRGEADSVGLGQVVKNLSLLSWAFYGCFRQRNFTDWIALETLLW